MKFSLRKLFLGIGVITILCSCACFTTYLFFGDSIIRAIYSGNAPHFLVSRLEERTVRPFHFYLNKADFLFVDLLFYTASLLFIMCLVQFCRARISNYLSIIISIVLAVASLEIFLRFALEHPSSFIGEVFRGVAVKLNEEDWTVIQFEEECSQYDRELTYTLRPGKCRFTNRDFATDVHINSMGLRDDEASLLSPEVIALGDSVSMGWGVEQEESYSQLVEKQLGIRVLNAAISSYGTVRELKLLKKLDRSQLKVLLIQYSQNDFVENDSYVRNGNRFTPMTSEAYANFKKFYEGKKRRGLSRSYARYTLTSLLPKLARPVIASMWRPSYPSLTQDYEAMVFFDVLRNELEVQKDVRIVLLTWDELQGQGITKAMLKHLSLYVQETGRDVRLIDLSDIIPENVFYRDTHPNAKGHRLISERLIRNLRSN